MRQQVVLSRKGRKKVQNCSQHKRLLVLLALLLLGLCLSSCDLGGSSDQKQSFTSSSNQTITYSSNAHDVVLRTFYGGATSGALQFGPQVSIYGDGSYTLGLERRGQLKGDGLQKLLSSLVDTYGLLSLKRTQFFDLPDQNATHLQLTMNGKQRELVYGSFGNQPQSKQDMDEYTRLEKALSLLNETLSGPTQAYVPNDYTLLARQVFYIDPAIEIAAWPLTDLPIAKVALYECGSIPKLDYKVSTNEEVACLKYTLPQHALLFSTERYQGIKAQLKQDQPTVFTENGLYYEVTVRPLLPDERVKQTVAMFGSTQLAYKGIPLQVDPLP